jgi:hypothetical protein
VVVSGVTRPLWSLTAYQLPAKGPTVGKPLSGVIVALSAKKESSLPAVLARVQPLRLPVSKPGLANNCIEAAFAEAASAKTLTTPQNFKVIIFHRENSCCRKR